MSLNVSVSVPLEDWDDDPAGAAEAAWATILSWPTRTIFLRVGRRWLVEIDTETGRAVDVTVVRD